MTIQFPPNSNGVVTEEDDQSITGYDPTYYYNTDFKGSDQGVDAGGERKKLQRIPTCAVFHKIAQGKGVPHTFIGWFSLSLLLLLFLHCCYPRIHSAVARFTSSRCALYPIL